MYSLTACTAICCPAIYSTYLSIYGVYSKHITCKLGVSYTPPRSKMWAHHHFLLFFTIHLIVIPSFFFINSASSSSSSVDHHHVDINDGSSGSSGSIAAAAAASRNNNNKLVDSICKQTSNYTFCVESIYTDPRAPKAHDYFLLAYISFGLAYLNATDTLSYIKQYKLEAEVEELQRCREDYEKAVSALEEAYNDLNSETYFDLKVLANSASQDALHCSSTQQQQQQLLLHSTSNFKEELAVGRKGDQRRGHSSSSSSVGVGVGVVLRKRNADLRGLCEICVIVSNQFSN